MSKKDTVGTPEGKSRSAIVTANEVPPKSEGTVGVFDLMSQVLADQTLGSSAKIALLDEIRKGRPAMEDRWVYRWIVYFLGAAVILTILGGFSTMMWGDKKDVPDGLIALGSAAIGALAGLLANRSDGRAE